MSTSYRQMMDPLHSPHNFSIANAKMRVSVFQTCLGRISRRRLRIILDPRRSTSTVDLRSDTVTLPSREMLESAMDAKLGDDVFGEDESVLELQQYMANMTGKKEVLLQK
jgi:hypothetical protein